MDFSEKFSALRKRAGLSQEETAQKLGVSRQTVSRWEMGSAFPDVVNIAAICRMFGVTADYLIDDSAGCAPSCESRGKEIKVTRMAFALWLTGAAVAAALILAGTLCLIPVFLPDGAGGFVVSSIVLNSCGLAVFGVEIVVVIRSVAGRRRNKDGRRIRADYAACAVFEVCSCILGLAAFVMTFVYAPYVTVPVIILCFAIALAVAGLVFFRVRAARTKELAMWPAFCVLTVWLALPFSLQAVVFIPLLACCGLKALHIALISMALFIIYLAVAVVLQIKMRRAR